MNWTPVLQFIGFIIYFRVTFAIWHKTFSDLDFRGHPFIRAAMYVSALAWPLLAIIFMAEEAITRHRKGQK